MSTIYVDNIIEKTTNAGVKIAGHVIQVVDATTQTQAASNSNSFVDTGLTVSITPKYA